MPSDYEAIRADHLRRYGEDVGNYGGLLVDLYADHTQFVLELLQNAQDAHATRVRFDLHQDRLEVRHDGRPFSEMDVRGICGIKRSTKEDDAEQIGRFGVGFKSVYAYTARPAVHCGDEHFRVENFVHPFPTSAIDPAAPWSTLQILPFDREDVSPEEAVDRISSRLQRLSGRTILFLNNLAQLEWSTPDGRSRKIRREQSTDGAARRVRLLTGAGPQPEEEWLVFDRSVQLSDGVDPGTVEVAFRLIRDEHGTEVITPAEDTELVAFFPTRRETHLGFLVQAPFVPTASRDSVRDDHPLNRRLVTEVAELTVEAMQALQDMDLLGVDMLQTLPLEPARFPAGHLLRPLYDTVRQALITRPLLPTADGRHLAATQVRLARGAGLRELLSPDQLGELLSLDSEVAWLVAGISADRTPTLHRYLVGHRPASWRTEPEVPALVPGIELDPDAIVRRLDSSFLDRQPAHWTVLLYRWLAGQPALLKTLRERPVIRRSDGQHVAAFEGDRPQVWLPPDGETSYPVVDRSVAADTEALDFLCRLGLTEPDAVDEVVTSILPRYQAGKAKLEDYASDLDLIAAAYTGATGDKLKTLSAELKRTKFLLVDDSTADKCYWCKPGGCYERSDELTVFLAGNPEAYFLTDKCLRHVEVWRRLGVRSEIEIKRREPDPWHGYVTVTTSHGWHQRGRHRFDPELQIVGLDHALTHLTLERSLLVWSVISSLDAPLRGEVESCTRQDYSGSCIETVDSPVAKLVAEHRWLLDADGNWRRPDEVTLEDLNPAYPRDEALSLRLGMVPTAARDVAEFLDIETDDLDMLRRRPDLLKKILAEARAQERGAVVDEDDEGRDDDTEDGPDIEPVDVAAAIFDAFNQEGEVDLEDFAGDGSSVNPARRRERSAAAFEQSQEAEPDPQARFEFLPRKAWEPRDPAVRAYLNQTYGGRCQICQATFPRRDGEPFFEARYIVPRVSRRWLNTPGNCLCLCPTCLAKTLHGSSKAAGILDELRELAVDAADLPDGGAISLELCGEPATIRFAQRHLIDLGVLLAAEPAVLQ